LYSGEQTGEEAEEVCPGSDVRGHGVYEHDGAEEGNDEEGDGDAEDEDGFLPCRHVGVLFFYCVGRPREEDEKEQHAVTSQQSRQQQRLGLGHNSHEEEASPLDGNLDYAQHSGCTGKAANFFAAVHVSGALRQRQDVGDAGRTGHGPEQDKHGTQAARGATGYDLDVLGEVRHEDTDDDEAAGVAGQ